MEVKPTKSTTSKVFYEFIKENILVRFGVSLKLVMDNAMYFSSTKIIEFYYENNIHLSHLSNYLPQGNGQVESSD